MKWTSLPRHTPRWIARHPVLLVEWLVACNALRRATMRRRLFQLAALALLLGSAGLAVAGPLAGDASNVVSALSEYWVATFIASAMYAAAAIARRQRASRQQFAASWLVATPISPRSESVSHAVRSLLPLLLRSAGAILLVAALVYLSASPSGRVRTIGYCIAAGAICGAAVGWWVRRTPVVENEVGSRYVLRARTTAQLHVSDAALSTWPLAQLMAWGRPANTRVLLIVALFAVQGGSSALHGLAVVACWFVASYLGGLLGASWRAIHDAAAWLRSTPLPFPRFAWSISRRALLHQWVGAAAAVLLFTALGSSWTMALHLAAAWLTIVVLAQAIVLTSTQR